MRHTQVKKKTKIITLSSLGVAVLVFFGVAAVAAAGFFNQNAHGDLKGVRCGISSMSFQNKCKEGKFRNLVVQCHDGKNKIFGNGRDCKTQAQLLSQSKGLCNNRCQKPPVPPRPLCQDSDGGLNYATAGTTTFRNGGLSVDYCDYSASSVYEYQCLDGQAVGQLHRCSDDQTDNLCFAQRCVAPTFHFENEKIRLDCFDCDEEDVPILEESFRLNTIAYDCLSEHLNYFPGIDPVTGSPKVRYVYTHLDEPADVGTEMYGWVLPFGYILTPGFVGIINNDTAVNRVEDVRLEVHELAHHFYFHTAGSRFIPSWLSEGFSIYFESTLWCDAKQYTIGNSPNDPLAAVSRLNTAMDDYRRIQNGERPLRNTSAGGHSRGSLFFAGLRLDYGCDGACVVRLWHAIVNAPVDAIRDTSDYVNSQAIQQIAEQVVGRDLDDLFNTVIYPENL